MVKKQQLAVGGLTDTASPASAVAAAATGYALPSFSYAWQWQWRWTSCRMHRSRTLSFRQQQQPAEQEEDDAKNGHGHHHQQQQQEEEEEPAYYKTMMNSVDFSGDYSLASVDTLASTASDEAESDEEAVLQALRSDRLLYEPADDDIEDDDASCCRLIKQQSINKHQKQAAVADNDGDDKPPQLDTTSCKAPPLTMTSTALAFGGATAMSVESHNPYRDFRESMEAMVMSKQGGVKDWSWLEEMLGWYLRANGKTTHGLIVAAFVDLLLALTTSPTAAAADYNYSSSSSSSSPVATGPSCWC